MNNARMIVRAAMGVAALALATPLMAQNTVYAIGNGGSSLLRFQSDDPSNVTVVGDFGGANTFLDALDFRPSTGQLYGYLDSTDSFYTVDVNTGQLTLADGPSSTATNTFQLGMDFNPRVDKARIITDSGQNLVYDPADGSVIAATSVFYGTGDANENASPLIIDNAYTQILPGLATTQQYAIDYGLDVLVQVANNDGTLTTIGSLGVHTGIYSGFDIFTSSEGTDTAYAVLTTGTGTGFYTINLSTGAATLVGELGFTNQVYSLAVIPAPGSVVAFGFAGMLVKRRRR